MESCRVLVSAAYFKRENGSINLSREHAEQLLKLCLDKLPKTFVILDGLDACDSMEIQEIVKILDKHARESEPGKIRLLFTSADDGDMQKGSIQKILSAGTRIDMGAEDNLQDIKNFVSIKTKELQDRFELSPEQTARTREKVTLRSEGTSRNLAIDEHPLP
jgi:hypothetical protein